MAQKRILLMYVHEYSGHHQAALALGRAFRRVDPKVKCEWVDALRYAHPILERLLQRTYLQIVRKRPQVWEYLYNNPSLVKSTQRLRRLIHRFHSQKLRNLLDGFKPGAILCTQAFPCGIVSDYKAAHQDPVLLYGVLTDFLPHAYWALEHVDGYFVPSQDAKEKLREDGVDPHRISIAGIPIDGSFNRPGPGIPRRIPLVLIMGGSQGIGPIEKIVEELDRLPEDFEMAVVAGKNKPLYRKLAKNLKNFRKKLDLSTYTDRMADLMKSAALLVSKPGGLTIAQALALRLPVIFIDPIPGQEQKNASFLLQHRAAIQARSEREVAFFVRQLLRTPAKIAAMKKNMRPLACPDAAERIARWVLAKGMDL